MFTAFLAVNGVSLIHGLLALKHTFALPVRFSLIWPAPLPVSKGLCIELLHLLAPCARRRLANCGTSLFIFILDKETEGLMC